MLEDLEYYCPKTIMTYADCGVSEFLYLEKIKDTTTNSDVYTLKLYQEAKNTLSFLGWTSFSCDFENKKSASLETFVNPKFRQVGNASFLIAYWIYLCKNAGLTELETIPVDDLYLAYTYKKIGFDLPVSTSHSSDKTVLICEREPEDKKTNYLVFHNENYANEFLGNNPEINSEDVTCEMASGTTVLDEVLLGSCYVLDDLDSAYSRVRKIIEK